jgi:hypothetical protein
MVQTRRGNHELWLSFFAIVVITIAYVFVVTWLGDVPGAGSFFGHSLGVMGFLLMLSTETLYTLRKRRRDAKWGRMSDWLDLHIFTGLVGPYMVFLHSSWKFNGLAGLVVLMTVVVVVSGFFGRYIYTAIPRSMDGMEIEASALQKEITEINTEFQGLLSARIDPSTRKVLRLYSNVPHSPLVLLFGRTIIGWIYRLQWWYIRRGLDPNFYPQAAYQVQLLRKRYELQQQVASLALARRLFSLWHTVHIPFGIVLFAAALIHIIGAFYYATLLR